VSVVDDEQVVLVLLVVLVLALGHHPLVVYVLHYERHLLLLPSCDDHGYSLDDEPAVLVVQNLVVRYVREHFSKHHED
jgi:hypothetical protein